MHWPSLSLAGIYVVGAVCTAAKTRYACRRLCNAMLVATGVLAVACLLVSILLVAGLTNVTWAPYAEGFTVFVLLTLMVAVLLNIKSISCVERPRRILVVGAHSDDLELACGGSLARFVDNGHEINALVMGRGARGGHERVRAGEAVSVVQLLDLTDITAHDFTDTCMSTETDEMMWAAKAMIDFAEPDITLTHSRNDQHQDYHAVHSATFRVARRCSTTLCFESPSVTNDFSVRFSVDIGDYMDVKIAAVRERANQSGKPYIDEQKLSGKTSHRGEQAKVGHAEGYEVVRALSSQLGSL